MPSPNYEIDDYMVSRYNDNLMTWRVEFADGRIIRVPIRNGRPNVYAAFYEKCHKQVYSGGRVKVLEQWAKELENDPMGA